MRDRTFSAEFASSISTLNEEDRIRALYARMTGVTLEDIADLPKSALLDLLREPEYRLLLEMTLALSETSTI